MFGIYLLDASVAGLALVAALVLKYRLNQTPADMQGFERSMREMPNFTELPFAAPLRVQ